MKRIKAVNGYTIYRATKRDEARYNVQEGEYYLYFSSDIRDYGIAQSDWDWSAETLELALEFAEGTNYATAREIVESYTTAASFEEIEAVEARLDRGESAEEIAEALEADEGESEAGSVQAIQEGRVFYVLCDSAEYIGTHGPYLTIEGADAAARHFAENTGAKYLPPAVNQ